MTTFLCHRAYNGEFLTNDSKMVVPPHLWPSLLSQGVAFSGFKTYKVHVLPFHGSSSGSKWAGNSGKRPPYVPARQVDTRPVVREVRDAPRPAVAKPEAARPVPRCDGIVRPMDLDSGPTVRLLQKELVRDQKPGSSSLVWPEHSLMYGSTEKSEPVSRPVPARYTGSEPGSLGLVRRTRRWVMDHTKGQGRLVAYGTEDGPELLGIPHPYVQELFESPAWRGYVGTFWNATRKWLEDQKPKEKAVVAKVVAKAVVAAKAPRASSVNSRR